MVGVVCNTEHVIDVVLGSAEFDLLQMTASE